MPPCMQNIVKKIKSKKDVSHQERYVITTYLLGIGTSETDIKNLMVLLPDYNEIVFSHQLNEMSKPKYEISSCSKIIDMTDICTPNSECIDLINPSDY